MEGTIDVEYDIEITISRHGADEENGPRFLDAFLKTHPESEPIVSQNTEDRTLTIAFSVEAEGAEEAFEKAKPIFADGCAASGLPLTEVVDLHISRAETRELQPAA